MRHLTLNIKSTSLVLFTAVIFLGSCKATKEENQPSKVATKSIQTFGIRHDKPLAQYELVAKNEAPYKTTDFPDFSPTVTIGVSFSGSSTDFDGTATGVLIAPNWVLTVGHNLYDMTQGDDPLPPAGISILTGADPNNYISKHTAENFVLHPTWKEGQQGLYDGNDISLIKLATPITNITPAKLIQNDGEALGNTIWLAGYGGYSDDFSVLPKRHAIENILDRKTSKTLTSKDGSSYAAGLLASDFDPLTSSSNPLGKNTTDPKIEAILGPGDSKVSLTEFEGTSVPGDSGGPLFIKVRNEWQICGVLSLSTSGDYDAGEVDDNLNFGYNSVTMYTRIAPHLKWIKETIKNN